MTSESDVPAGLSREKYQAILAEVEREYDPKRKLSPQVKLIAFLAAVRGKEAFHIAQELEMPQLFIEQILAKQPVKAEIERLQKELFNSVKDRVNQLAILGIQFYEDVMSGKITAANKDKISIVRDVHNRAFGKPVERIQVESQTIRQLFEELDRARKLSIAAPAEQVQNNTKVIEGEATVVESPVDDISEYLESQTPHSGIGKGKIVDKDSGQDG